MPEDTSRTEPPSLAQGDRLYQGFPDFSAWGPLPPEDVDLWSRFAASLTEKRQKATPASLKSTVEVAVRAAALDTGAIEGLYSVDRGFTMTVAVQGLAWQQMIEERGAGVRELFEAQLAAYELVLDAVTHRLPITEAWIRSLHETLCAPQKVYRVLTEVGWQEQELPKGQYKTRPNHVLLTDGTIHAYAPVDRVPDEMHRLIEQIRTPEFETAHPVLQASYCHYAFVVIHPFPDGNGRVARALASTFFYRAQWIPLLIFANQRPAYLDALTSADQGDYEPVLSFFLNRGIDTMQLVAENLVTAAMTKPEDLAVKLHRASKIWRVLPYHELKAISERILNQLAGMFMAKVGALNLKTLSATWDYSKPTREDSNNEHTCVVAGKFTLQSTEPRHQCSFAWVYIRYSCNPDPFPFRIWHYSEQLEARLEDVVSELTPHFIVRLDQWTQRLLGRMLADIASKSLK